MGNNEQNPDQGNLFEVGVSNTGATDPELQKRLETLTPVPGGVYKADAETQTSAADAFHDPALLAAVKAANKTRRNRQAQLGRHSAIDEATGRHTDVAAGKVLPGFGPVRHKDIEDGSATEFAEHLDK